MYFKDLSDYSYGTYYGPDRPITLPEVQNIGWLETGNSYPKGKVDSQTLSKLAEILANAQKGLRRIEVSEGKSSIQDLLPQDLKQAIAMCYANTIPHKGSHFCDLCVPRGTWETRPQLSTADGPIFLGSKEIWLPSIRHKESFYASPDLVYHYMLDHEYLPPNEFLNAIRHYEIGSAWNAWEQRKVLLELARNRIQLSKDDPT